MRHDRLVFTAIICTTTACSPSADGWTVLDGVGVLGVSSGEAYVCGQGSATELSRWLSGGDVLEDDAGVWALSVDRDGAFTLDGDGERWSGSLTPFVDGGLYAASPDGCRSGAVLFEGDLAGTWCNRAGTFRQVEPVDAVTGSPDTIEVRRVDLADDTFTLERQP